MKIISLSFALAFVATFLCVGLTSSTPYDPWYDFNHNGEIDIFDVVDIAGRYGTTGTPINTTDLLLELQDRLDALNTTVMMFQGTCQAESGEFNGVVNADMVEDPGANTVINFQNPFTSREKPDMLIHVVLKQAANGLTEGSAIKAVEDIKGTAGSWTGFDLTVSKYSDGTSIDDLTQVYVTWIAVKAAGTSRPQVYADLISDSTDSSGTVDVSYPIGLFADTPTLSVTVQFNSGGIAQMGYVTIYSHSKDGFTLNVKDGFGTNWSGSVQISYVAVEPTD